MTAPPVNRPPAATAGTAALLLSMAAELPLLRVFGSPGLRLIVLSVPLAVVIATIAWTASGRLFRGRPSAGQAIVGFGAGLIIGAFPGLLLATADQFGSGSWPARLGSAVRDGWFRILSVPVPVPDTRSFTDLPVLLAAALSALIAVIALTRRPLLALIPATLGFGGQLVLGIHGPGSAFLLAGAYVLAAVIFLMTLGSPVARRPFTTTAFAVTVLLTAALITSAWRPAAPYDPRTALRVPVRSVQAQDPLALLPARLQTPHVLVFTARLSGALRAHPRNWVVLAYENYDGTGWLPAGAASPVAGGLPAPDAAGTGTAVVSLRHPTTLLPHPSYVLSALPADLGYGSEPELLTSPAVIARYTVRVSVTQPSARALSSATVPAGTPALLTQVPACVPAAVRDLAVQARQQASQAPEQAIRLEQLLKFGRFRYDQAAPPGEGCGNLSRLFATHRGTSAQFATAFALAARMLGLPARVAAGYLPGQVTGTRDTVTDADAYAWPQVLLAGVGWVDFDPTPRAGASSTSPAREKQPALTKVKIQKPSRQATKKVPKITAPTLSPRSGSGLARWIVLGVSLAVPVLLVLLVGWWFRPRWRRLRRRRAPEPAMRALAPGTKCCPRLSEPACRFRAAARPESRPRQGTCSTTTLTRSPGWRFWPSGHSTTRSPNRTRTRPGS